MNRSILFIASSQDTVPPLFKRSAQKIKQTDSDDHIAGYLPLVVGMPVILKSNVATELGLCNGSQGTLVGFSKTIDTTDRYPAEEIIIDNLEYLLVRFPQSKHQCLPGLPEGVVPIFPIKTTFSFKVSKNKSISISRKQFPIVPGKSITVHAAQGKTLDMVIVDLAVPGGRRGRGFDPENFM